MADLIASIPSYFVWIVLILLLLLLYFVVKHLGTKGSEKKSSKKEESSVTKKEAKVKKTDKKSKEIVTEKQENPEKSEQTEQGEEEKVVKKTRPVKAVEKVFKKDDTPDEIDILPVEDEPEEKVMQKSSYSSVTEDDLLSRMKFVKTSNRVSKLVKIEKDVPKVEENPAEVEATEIVAEPVALEEKKETKAGNKYFDHSRRLSNFIKNNNFDDMFETHLSDKYLNISSSNYIKDEDSLKGRLYERASKTIANSDVRLNKSYSGNPNYEIDESEIEQNRRRILASLISENNFDETETSLPVDKSPNDMRLDAKSIMMAEALLQKKSGKKTAR